MSSSGQSVGARAPRRERGRRRVATLLEAAVSLFAEKGYDAVTMTEVAARAGAPIGSLYQFFPSKEALADAILERFGGQIADALGEVERRAATESLPELAGALLGLMAGLQEERAAASELIEARREASTRASELRLALRGHVARILRARIPTLPTARAESMARVVVQLIKAAARQADEPDRATRDDVLDELKHLLCLYLSNAMIR